MSDEFADEFFDDETPDQGQEQGQTQSQSKGTKPVLSEDGIAIWQNEYQGNTFYSIRDETLKGQDGENYTIQGRFMGANLTPEHVFDLATGCAIDLHDAVKKSTGEKFRVCAIPVEIVPKRNGKGWTMEMQAAFPQYGRTKDGKQTSEIDAWLINDTYVKCSVRCSGQTIKIPVESCLDLLNFNVPEKGLELQSEKREGAAFTIKPLRTEPTKDGKRQKLVCIVTDLDEKRAASWAEYVEKKKAESMGAEGQAPVQTQTQRRPMRVGGR